MKLKLQWEPQIKEALDEVLNSHYPHPVAVFDFDNTLIYGDHGLNLMNYIIFHLQLKANEDWFWHPKLWYNIENNMILKIKSIYEKAKEDLENLYWRNELLYNVYRVFQTLELIDLEIAYRWTKIFFAGFTVKELKELSKISFEEALKLDCKEIFLKENVIIQQGIRINPLLLELIETLKEKQWEVYIITATPEIAIQAISYYWNIDEDHVIGMKLKINNHILLPEIIEPYTYSEGKYKSLQNKSNAPILIAVGDSYPDIELLTKAKIPIFLKRRGKEDLVDLARKKHFYIQNIEDE